ncbi:MAG: glycosyltransferase family 4 protein [Pseudomonadota bacterium]
MHIITRLDMGGSAQNTLLTCLGLSDKYDLVLVYGLSSESRMTGAERRSVEKKMAIAEKKGVKLIPLPPLIRKIDPLKDFRTFVWLYRLIRREKPIIVHTHTSKAGLLGRWAACIAGVPFIVHTPHGHVFFGHFNTLLAKLFFLLERLTATVTDRIIALTGGEKADYIRLFVARPDKIVTIHSGVNIEQFMNVPVNVEAKKKSLGLNPTSLVVGTVGWLLPIKGPMHLLNAMGDVWQSRLDVELVYVGKGDLEEAIKQQALKMGVSERVKVLGWRDDIHEIMPVIDLFVLPSLNEGMGRVLVEAMAAGKPIVASNVGGVPDLVHHGENGLLVEPGDETGLSVAIEKLLADENRRHEMGKRGQSVARDFSEEKMIEKIDALYASLFHPPKQAV